VRFEERRLNPDEPRGRRSWRSTGVFVHRDDFALRQRGDRLQIERRGGASSSVIPYCWAKGVDHERRQVSNPRVSPILRAGTSDGEREQVPP